MRLMMKKHDTLLAELANTNTFDFDRVKSINKIILLDITEEYTRFKSDVLAKLLTRTDADEEERELVESEYISIFKIAIEAHASCYRVYPEIIVYEEFVQEVVNNTMHTGAVDYDWEEDTGILYTLLYENSSHVNSIMLSIEQKIKNVGYELPKLKPFRWIENWVNYEIATLKCIFADCLIAENERDEDYLTSPYNKYY
jgi:hypothetical protein